MRLPVYVVPDVSETTGQKWGTEIVAKVDEMVGWGGRDRTSECRNQNPVPYRLATPQQSNATAL